MSDTQPDQFSIEEEFDDFINVPLIRAARRLQLHFYKTALMPLDLSIQEWRTLLNLKKLGDTHLRELARFGHLDPTHVSRVAVQLEKRGLIKRYNDPQDSRRKRLAITNDGSQLVSHIWPSAKALTQAVRNELGETQYGALQQALATILEADTFMNDPDGPALAAE